MDEVQSLAHTKWECKYHIVWIPKDRWKVLYPLQRTECSPPVWVFPRLRSGPFEGPANGKPPALPVVVDCIIKEILRQQAPLKTPSGPRKWHLFARGLQFVRFPVPSPGATGRIFRSRSRWRLPSGPAGTLPR